MASVGERSEGLDGTGTVRGQSAGLVRQAQGRRGSPKVRWVYGVKEEMAER